jgi:hypothetical protein
MKTQFVKGWQKKPSFQDWLYSTAHHDQIAITIVPIVLILVPVVLTLLRAIAVGLQCKYVNPIKYFNLLITKK